MGAMAPYTVHVSILKTNGLHEQIDGIWESLNSQFALVREIEINISKKKRLAKKLFEHALKQANLI